MKKAAYIIIPFFLLSLIAAPSCSAEEKPQFKGPIAGERSGGPPEMKRGGVDIPHGRWWKRNRVKEGLGLTDKQIAKLDEISIAGRKKMIRVHADIEVLSLDLEPILNAKNFDRSAAEKILNKIEGLRAEAAKVRVAELLDMREVLTHDQFLKLKEIKGKRDHRGKRREPRK